MYHHRLIEKKVTNITRYAKIILILGARQVGKSTLLKHLFPGLRHFLFDPVQDFYNVKQDPDLFLNNFLPPLILDEIQFAPELLPALKRHVDESEEMGQYFLTGSQNLSMMRQVSESLAGRVAILNLGTMTPGEILNQTNSHNWLHAYLENPRQFLAIEKGCLKSSYSLFELLWRGGFPGLLGRPNEWVPNYFLSYIQTYLERDIRLIDNIKDLHQFDRFLGILSALTAQEINYTHLGREIGLTAHTAKHWLDLLTYSYQWFEVWPYLGNTIKRLSHRRKGYLMDTGLACYLQRISSPEALARHPSLGAIFETFVVNLLLRNSEGLSISPQFYHWRTNGGAEVDLIMEYNHNFYPIEIKAKSVVNKHDSRGIQAFQQTFPNLTIMPGIVIYAGKESYPLTEDIWALPWDVHL